MNTPDKRTPEEKLAELERIHAEQDRKTEEREKRHLKQIADPRVQRGIEARVRDNPALLDGLLGPIADEIVDGLTRLAGMLHDLDVISEENPGTPRYRYDIGTGSLVDGIEADHPDDGKRLYTFNPGTDAIMASRLRPDGRYEHAVLDEYGMEGEWRMAPRPDLN